MPNILTGWGLLNPDSVDYWDIETVDPNKVSVKSFVGGNCSSTHWVTSENFKKLDNLKSYAGLFMEAINHVLEKPNEHGNKIHFFEATALMEEVAGIVGVDEYEDSQQMETLYHAVLSAAEGSLISIAGIDPLLSRVDAYMILKDMVERPAHGDIVVKYYSHKDIFL